MKLDILYIFPFDFYGYRTVHNSFLTIFNRISNYIHSKEVPPGCKIQEEYVDLRYEDLPAYTPENIDVYRQKLEKILLHIYSGFPFDMVSISCYSSFHYLNTVEVAAMIRSKINPECIIVVGGPHATIRPMDFNLNHLPRYITRHYELQSTPFTYLIKEEGEIPFYKLIRRYFRNGSPQKVHHKKHAKCKILAPELVEDLNSLPPLDVELFRRYEEVLNRNLFNLNIEFSRGCPFQCKYCPNSAHYINCYKKVRVKSVDNCMRELHHLSETDWLKIKHLFINDMIFMPKRSKKREFFEEILRSQRERGQFPFRIEVEERVDLCSKEDLEKYAQSQIIPQFGLETASKTLLARIGKILGVEQSTIRRGAEMYLRKAEELIIHANKLELPVSFFYVIGLPGTDRHTINESKEFFLEKRFTNTSLIESYNVNLRFALYHAYFGTYFYDNAEQVYGTKMLCEQWWRKFSGDQIYYSQLVHPSDKISLPEVIESYNLFLKQVFNSQNKLKNSFYSVYKYTYFKEWMDKVLALYEVIS
ncbi:MAG: putative Radical SAM superfamily protein [Promethearchaeota archaeon]|nr:MAG: putative Radical SAM superfamily protein [Candidatus Lokiarchaeota archaeon]